MDAPISCQNTKDFHQTKVQTTVCSQIKYLTAI